MESDGDKNEILGGLSPPRSNSHLFNVVYDPRFDLFFLEDEGRHRDRLERQAVAIPWEKLTLPPKSATKVSQDATGTNEGIAEGVEAVAQPTTIQDPSKQEVLSPALDEAPNIATRRNHEPVPVLDLSSLQQPLLEASVHSVNSIAADVVMRSSKAKKTRVQDYAAHFKRSNKEVEKVIRKGAETAKPNDEHEIKWTGEVLRVQVARLHQRVESDVGITQSTDALQREIVSGPALDQWPASTFELKNLTRIRPHADGFRGPAVNSACSFVSVSSSESSDSDQEYVNPQHQESEEETDLMPVFYRDDRVLFHAKRCWLEGTVRRRIPSSDFYDIRADNGSYFEAVLATKIQLLDEQDEEPYYHFVRGDKVLWTPDSSAAEDQQSIHKSTRKKSSRRRRQSDNTEEPQTYKAKIVQVRSLSRFDLLLRTGRVVKKIPRKQLRPREAFAFAFASSATARHR